MKTVILERLRQLGEHPDFGDVAEALLVHDKTVRRWVALGTFPRPIRISSRRSIFRREDIIAHVERRAAAGEPVCA